eukprot:Platyproteum_vivax@DN3827_c0_g1_i1.p1
MKWSVVFGFAFLINVVTSANRSLPPRRLSSKLEPASIIPSGIANSHLIQLEKSMERANKELDAELYFRSDSDSSSGYTLQPEYKRPSSGTFQADALPTEEYHKELDSWSYSEITPAGSHNNIFEPDSSSGDISDLTNEDELDSWNDYDITSSSGFADYTYPEHEPKNTYPEHEPKNDVYKCLVCGKYYMSPHKIFDHLKKDHKLKRPWGAHMKALGPSVALHRSTSRSESSSDEPQQFRETVRERGIQKLRRKTRRRDTSYSSTSDSELSEPVKKRLPVRKLHQKKKDRDSARKVYDEKSKQRANKEFRSGIGIGDTLSEDEPENDEAYRTLLNKCEEKKNGKFNRNSEEIAENEAVIASQTERIRELQSFIEEENNENIDNDKECHW